MSEADAQRVTEYLRGRGFFERLIAPPSLTPLTGGVSGETILVESTTERVVVKRALGKLRVTGDWTAKPERAVTEAAALRLLHALTPGHAPTLLDADPETNTLVIGAAPADWVAWKDVLLGAVPDPTAGPVYVAGELGAVLGQWHRDTWHDARVAAEFNDYEAFDQLRVSPFHRTVAAAHPALAGTVNNCADELLSRRDCLVHGDFSPKNVLVGGDGFFVLDFEVAHFGAAVFDLAFMSCHLALKAMHMPHRAAAFAAAAAAFLSAYQAVPGGQASLDLTASRLGWHTACLILARVDGLSPATYLAAETAKQVRAVALKTLASTDASADALWDLVTSAAGEVAS